MSSEAAVTAAMPESTAAHAGPPTAARRPVRGGPLLRVLRRVFRRTGGQQAPLAVLAEQVSDAFYPGMRFTDPRAGAWVATLDALHAFDRQVVAMIRLTPAGAERPRRASGPTPVTPLGTEAPTVRNLSAPSEPDALFQYSFPEYLPVEDNLAMLREYVEKQLPRLAPRPRRRGAPR